MTEIVGVLVAQDKDSGRLDLVWFVAMHLCDRVRPRPGVGVVAVFEGADALRGAAEERTIQSPRWCWAIGGGFAASPAT